VALPNVAAELCCLLFVQYGLCALGALRCTPTPCWGRQRCLDLLLLLLLLLLLAGRAAAGRGALGRRRSSPGVAVAVSRCCWLISVCCCLSHVCIAAPTAAASCLATTSTV
jgi:hypothetical protein